MGEAWHPRSPPGFHWALPAKVSLLLAGFKDFIGNALFSLAPETPRGKLPAEAIGDCSEATRSLSLSPCKPASESDGVIHSHWKSTLEAGFFPKSQPGALGDWSGPGLGSARDW